MADFEQRVAAVRRAIVGTKDAMVGMHQDGKTAVQLREHLGKLMEIEQRLLSEPAGDYATRAPGRIGGLRAWLQAIAGPLDASELRQAARDALAADDARAAGLKSEPDTPGVALGDGAEQRVEAFAARRLAEIRGCKLGCGAVGQCKANAHGNPSECPARGVRVLEACPGIDKCHTRKAPLGDGRACSPKCYGAHGVTEAPAPKPPKCSRCMGEGTIDQTGYGEYRPCPDCNPASPYYEPPARVAEVHGETFCGKSPMEESKP
jgi:hypothetical protein